MTEIDKMYNEILKRCGISNCTESAVQDNFVDTYINILEKHETTPECNDVQSGYSSDVNRVFFCQNNSTLFIIKHVYK